MRAFTRQVLAKSCKMVPVMLMGYLVNRKTCAPGYTHRYATNPRTRDTALESTTTSCMTTSETIQPPEAIALRDHGHRSLQLTTLCGSKSQDGRLRD